MYAGQCVYSRTTDTYSDGAQSSRYSAGPSPVGDITLSTTGLVVQEETGGSLTPKTITLTATVQNLPAELSWKKEKNPITVTGSSLEIDTTEVFKDVDSVTYSVSCSEYPDYVDQVTIVKVKEGIEGKDAISVILTNPTMVFNDGSIHQGKTETTRVQVYQGITQIEYNNTDKELYYTIKTTDVQSSCDTRTGVITVTNPRESKNIPITVELYKDKNKIEEIDLQIICTVVSNGEYGKDAVLCYIDSSAGTMLEQNSQESVTLYARMIQNGTDIVSGYNITWYKVGPTGDEPIGATSQDYTFTNNTMTTKASNLISSSYYFKATEKS